MAISSRKRLPKSLPPATPQPQLSFRRKDSKNHKRRSSKPTYSVQVDSQFPVVDGNTRAHANRLFANLLPVDRINKLEKS